MIEKKSNEEFKRKQDEIDRRRIEDALYIAQRRINSGKEQYQGIWNLSDAARASISKNEIKVLSSSYQSLLKYKDSPFDDKNQVNTALREIEKIIDKFENISNKDR